MLKSQLLVTVLWVFFFDWGFGYLNRVGIHRASPILTRIHATLQYNHRLPRDRGTDSTPPIVADDVLIQNKEALVASSAPDVLLPVLSPSEVRMLSAGHRVQKQRRTGRAGAGWVVLEVPAPVQDVFGALASFQRYEDIIPTVRSVKQYGAGTSTVHKAEYSLSKFRLKVNVLHTIQAEQGLIKFSLDNEKPNLVLRRADGFWHVQPVEGRPSATRVYFSAEIVVSSVVPSLIVDYASCRALNRATKWIQPYFQHRDD